MNPQDWTRYCRATPLLQHRRQSAAFIAAYGLAPLPLLAHSKIALTGAPPKFPDWYDVDHPDERNWSVAIPRITPVAVWADIDCDTRTLSTATEWTDELLVEARAYQRIVHDAFDFFGVSCHRFGRDSLDSLGHTILPIDITPQNGLRQTPLELLDLLHMRRTVRVGNLRVGIEMRRASEKRLVIPKSMTLPGSTYPALIDKTQLDLIQWREALPEGQNWGRVLSPQPVHAVRMAVYAALLTLGVIRLWTPGDRHHMALMVSGALAHEASVGFLGNDEAGQEDARRVFEFILRKVGDPDAKDRLKAFDDTMTAMDAGRPVTGYRTLREGIDNEDLVKALLSMRGGSDPDAISTMFRNAVYVERDDRWLWMPESSRLLTLRPNEAMQRMLRHHPDYPAVPRRGRSGDVQIIDMVMNSDRKRRIRETVSFPGVPFGTRYFWDSTDYVELDDDAPDAACDALNVSTGFATKPLDEGEKPDEEVYAKAVKLWRRHRAWITQDDPLQNRKLDQLIARKIQFPRIKYQLGCALTGGQGIGKSALFNVVLKAIVGTELIGRSTRADMNSEFRYRKLDKSLFYILEEFRLSGAKPEVQESIKDLMRNDLIERNRKYGSQDTCRNVAIPFITSNERNPSLLVDGMPDRALVVIHGHSQESLGMTALEWTRIKSQVFDEVQEFKQALEDPDIREALFHYWATIDIDEKIFDDTEATGVSPEDVINALPTLQQAIIDMFASGTVFQGREAHNGPSIDEPFPLEGMAEVLSMRIRKPVSAIEAGRAFSDLFMDSKFKNDARHHNKVNRDNRDKMLRSKKWTPHGSSRRRFYYFRERRGEIGVWLKEFRNIELEFEREMDPIDDFGRTPEPDQKTLERAKERWATMGISRSLGSP